MYKTGNRGTNRQSDLRKFPVNEMQWGWTQRVIVSPLVVLSIWKTANPSAKQAAALGEGMPQFGSVMGLKGHIKAWSPACELWEPVEGGKGC